MPLLKMALPNRSKPYTSGKTARNELRTEGNIRGIWLSSQTGKSTPGRHPPVRTHFLLTSRRGKVE